MSGVDDGAASVAGAASVVGAAAAGAAASVAGAVVSSLMVLLWLILHALGIVVVA